MGERTILCCGDSNTYGYDTRSFLPGRYPSGDRWCDLLAEHTGWKVINEGENGRTLPVSDWDYEHAMDILGRNMPVDRLVIMLGTNDVLNDKLESAGQIAARMERLLVLIRDTWPQTPITLLAPPPITIPVAWPVEKAALLRTEYESLARKYGLDYCDVTEWELPMMPDGVHMTVKANHIFARMLQQELE